MSQKDQAFEKVQDAFKKCEFALWLLRKKNYQKSMLYSQILDIFFTFSYENFILMNDFILEIQTNQSLNDLSKEQVNIFIDRVKGATYRALMKKKMVENQHQQIFKLISILSRMQFTILA